jgi:photosystem II stability/assembly factor-like uncharacterized protein
MGNAGRSWSRLPPIRLGPHAQIAQLQFVDALPGWIVVVRGAGMSQISFDLYHTVDGGSIPSGVTMPSIKSPIRRISLFPFSR